MQLLPEEKLIWSPIVANSRMNRERKSSGVNSYEKEFGFAPEIFLENIICQSGEAAWLDLCCGEGNALIQTAEYLTNKKYQDRVKLTGIDLLDQFQSVGEHITCIRFIARPVVDFKSPEQYDLITCSHGLHYPGDKLKVIEQAIQTLKPSGLFIANLDLANISIEGVDDSYLKSLFKANAITYNGRSKLIKRAGNIPVRFNLDYLGADDASGPNYTGQDAVTSYYRLTK